MWELSHPSLVDEQTCGVSGGCLPHIRQDICSSGWNTAKISAQVGRNLSLASLGNYLSRDLVTNPENKILKTAGDKTNSTFPAIFFELFCVHPMLRQLEMSPHLGFCLLHAWLVFSWKPIIKRHIYCVANQNLLLSPPH